MYNEIPKINIIEIGSYDTANLIEFQKRPKTVRKIKQLLKYLPSSK